jgi:hypothetical protein
MRITFEADERPALLTKLGLEDKATDEEITTAFTEWANDDNPVEGSGTGAGNGTGTGAGNGEGSGNGTQQTPEQAAAAAFAAALAQQHQREQGNGGGGNGQGEGAQQPPPEDGDTDDVVVLDISAYQSLEARAKRTEHLEEEQRLSNRKDLIEGAIKAGKFGAGRKDHYEARFDSDPEDTIRIIGMMRKGVVPVDERGTDADPDEIATDAYPADWLPEVNAQQGGEPAANGNGTATLRRNRVQSEE